MKTIPRILRRIFSSWHALLAASIALVIYLALPPIVRAYDPTAAVFDGGYLIWVGLATALAFWVIAFAWIMFQIAFASLDRASGGEKGEWAKLDEWFHYMKPVHRWMAVQGFFTLCIIILLICLALVPL